MVAGSRGVGRHLSAWRPRRVSRASQGSARRVGGTVADTAIDPPDLRRPATINPSRPAGAGMSRTRSVSRSIAAPTGTGVQSGLQVPDVVQYSVPSSARTSTTNVQTCRSTKAVQVLERHNLIARPGSTSVTTAVPAGVHDGRHVDARLPQQPSSARSARHANVEYSVPLVTLFGLSIRGPRFLRLGLTPRSRMPRTTSAATCRNRPATTPRRWRHSRIRSASGRAVSKADRVCP